MTVNVVACLFIAWALLRPLGRELEEAEAEAGGGDAEAADSAAEPRFSRDEEPARPRVPEAR